MPQFQQLPQLRVYVSVFPSYFVFVSALLESSVLPVLKSYWKKLWMNKSQITVCYNNGYSFSISDKIDFFVILYRQGNASVCSFFLVCYPCSMDICLLLKKIYIYFYIIIILYYNNYTIIIYIILDIIRYNYIIIIYNIYNKNQLWNYKRQCLRQKYRGFTKLNKCLIIPSFSFLANASIWIVGSDPMDRKHIKGVLVSLSSQVFSRFRITGSVYLSSKESAMYFLAWKTVRSGHQDLEMNASYRKKFSVFIFHSI